MSIETRTLPEFPQYTFRADGVVLSVLRPHGVRSRLVRGYPTVCLVGDAKGSRVLARLIYTAFYGPLPPAHRVSFRDGNPVNCAADNLYCSPYTRPSRWPVRHVRQPLAVSLLKSKTCHECGGDFDFRDRAAVRFTRNRRCRFCREGLCADLGEHERHEAALGAFGVPTYSTEELLDIRHLCIELWDLIKTLPGLQQHVLYYRFWEARALEDTAGILRRSRERVRQIESQAVLKLHDMYTRPDAKTQDPVRQAVEPKVPRRKTRAAFEKTTQEDRLRRARDADPRVRKEAATDPDMPARVVADLAADVDSDVRYMIAVRPNLPRALVERLTQDPVWQVREAANRAMRRFRHADAAASAKGQER